MSENIWFFDKKSIVQACVHTVTTIEKWEVSYDSQCAFW